MTDKHSKDDIEHAGPGAPSAPPVDAGTTDAPPAMDCGDTGAEEVGPLHEKFYRPFLLLVFIGAVAVLLALLWPFRHSIFLAAILALLLAPLRKRMLPVLWGSRLVTAALLSTATLFFIVLPTATLIVILANEAGTVIEAGVHWFNDGGMAAFLGWFKSLGLPDWLQAIVNKIPFDPQELKTSLVGAAGGVGKGILSVGRGFAGQMTSFLAQVVMLLLFLFYFLAEAERVVKGLRRLSPLRRCQEQELAERLKMVTRSILAGGVAAGLSQGLATAVGLWIVGIDALFWGMVAIVASLVPIIGRPHPHSFRALPVCPGLQRQGDISALLVAFGGEHRGQRGAPIFHKRERAAAPADDLRIHRGRRAPLRAAGDHLRPCGHEPVPCGLSAVHRGPEDGVASPAGEGCGTGWEGRGRASGKHLTNEKAAHRTA